MPRIVTAQRHNYVPPRYLLSDWAGPLGIYSVTKELAADLRRLSYLPDSDIDLDYRIRKFADGRITTKPEQILPSVFLEMYPDADLYL